MTVVLGLIVGEKSHKLGRESTAQIGRFSEESAFLARVNKSSSSITGTVYLVLPVIYYLYLYQALWHCALAVVVIFDPLLLLCIIHRVSHSQPREYDKITWQKTEAISHQAQ